MTKILAVIPVKMNSRRLKKKNVKLLNGYPMFLWTYAAAINCKYISKIVISSEATSVHNIAKKYGYKDNYIRPKKLIKDKFSNSDVVLDVLENQMKLGNNYDHVILLQPTSPIRQKGTLNKFIKNYLNSNCKSGLSLKGPIYKKYNFLGSLRNNKFTSTQKNLKNKVFYSPSASIYISEVKNFFNEKKFFIDPIFGYIVDKFEATDIDYVEDFKIAGLILKNKLLNVHKPIKLKN